MQGYGDTRADLEAIMMEEAGVMEAAIIIRESIPNRVMSRNVHGKESVFCGHVAVSKS